LDEGIGLLELAQKAGRLFRQQPSAAKRRLLGFVLSHCSWKNGQLTAAYRQPFDQLAKNVIAVEAKTPVKRTQTGDFDIGLPTVDPYRTFCIAPSPEVRLLLASIREFRATS
jgi:hypothetical protein